MNSEQLVTSLKKAVASERKIMGIVIDRIREVNRRRVYLEYHYPSLFAFLVGEIGYSNASAQARIDAAKLGDEIPSVITDIKDGSLDLSRVGLVAKAVRQKVASGGEVKTEDKAQLLEMVKDKTEAQAQVIVAKTLDIKIEQTEKKKFQQDESVRLEMTLSKEEMELVLRAKELMSHTDPQALRDEKYRRPKQQNPSHFQTAKR